MVAKKAWNRVNGQSNRLPILKKITSFFQTSRHDTSEDVIEDDDIVEDDSDKQFVVVEKKTHKKVAAGQKVRDVVGQSSSHLDQSSSRCPSNDRSVSQCCPKHLDRISPNSPIIGSPKICCHMETRINHRTEINCIEGFDDIQVERSEDNFASVLFSPRPHKSGCKLRVSHQGQAMNRLERPQDVYSINPFGTPELRRIHCSTAVTRGGSFKNKQPMALKTRDDQIECSRESHKKGFGHHTPPELVLSMISQNTTPVTTKPLGKQLSRTNSIFEKTGKQRARCKTRTQPPDVHGAGFHVKPSSKQIRFQSTEKKQSRSKNFPGNYSSSSSSCSLESGRGEDGRQKFEGPHQINSQIKADRIQTTSNQPRHKNVFETVPYSELSTPLVSRNSKNLIENPRSPYHPSGVDYGKNYIREIEFPPDRRSSKDLLKPPECTRAHEICITTSKGGTRETAKPETSHRPSKLCTNWVRQHAQLLPASGTQHLSLRRRKHPDSATEAQLSDKGRPLSSVFSFESKKNEDRQGVVDKFLIANLSSHRKGLLGRIVPLKNMLVWTKDAIPKPMLRTDSKIVKKEAPEIFRLIQSYMGDRKCKESTAGMAKTLLYKGLEVSEFCDEIFLQLCRQTTENPQNQSFIRGLELLGLCVTFTAPSNQLHPYLESHFSKVLIGANIPIGQDFGNLRRYSACCIRRLDNVSRAGIKRFPSHDEIQLCMKSMLKPTVFGVTLEDVMELQKDQFSNLRLPWIQTVLSEELLRRSNFQLPEGLFRIPGDADVVSALKSSCERWVPPPTDSRTDSHAIASLLKLWYREMLDPLIPDNFYEECIESRCDPEAAIKVVHRLPEINLTVLTYLIQFLQKFASPSISSVTKMDASNLAMVMAPNCLRCRSTNPQVLLDNARKEMVFMRTLILHLDTTDCRKDHIV